MSSYGRGKFEQKIDVSLDISRVDGCPCELEDENNITFLLEEAEFSIDSIDTSDVDGTTHVEAFMEVTGSYEWEDKSYDSPGFFESEEASDEDIRNMINDISKSLKDYGLECDDYSFNENTERM